MSVNSIEKNVADRYAESVCACPRLEAPEPRPGPPTELRPVGMIVDNQDIGATPFVAAPHVDVQWLLHDVPMHQCTHGLNVRPVDQATAGPHWI